MILVILNFHIALLALTKFRHNRAYGSGGEMLFEKFKDGGHGRHIGHQNITTLAILNLRVTPLSSTKLRLTPTHGSGGHVL